MGAEPDRADGHLRARAARLGRGLILPIAAGRTGLDPGYRLEVADAHGQRRGEAEGAVGDGAGEAVDGAVAG